jgi:hypothetical protein
VKRFTLYGSPHSLPTYKVALMLRLSDEPFSFRYVSFQKGMHKSSEFLALSRWGQVPVLVDNGRIYAQSSPDTMVLRFVRPPEGCSCHPKMPPRGLWQSSPHRLARPGSNRGLATTETDIRW